MSVFGYKALDSNRKKVSGLIEAQNAKEARQKLRQADVIVTELVEKKQESFRKKISDEQLISFTEQLAQLIGAGVPIYESLVALEEQWRAETFNRVILGLCEQVKMGKSLSQAMKNYPEIFNSLYCSLILAGESVGSLDEVLKRLLQLLKKQYNLKKQLFNAMIYPSILAVFCFVLMVILLGFVVPSIRQIFTNQELNALTRFVLGASDLFLNWWWLIFSGLTAFFLWVFVWIKSVRGKKWLQKNLLKVPLISSILIESALARFCRTMSTLQKGGLTTIESLQISRQMMQNVVLEEEMNRAEKKIMEGSSLSVEFSKSRWIPRLVSKMLAVGQESGSTSEMFDKIAEMYEDRLEKTLAQTMALAQPVILIIMGALIGAVMFAILLPLADMSAFGV